MRPILLIVLIFSSFTSFAQRKVATIVKTIHTEKVNEQKMRWRFLGGTEEDALREIFNILQKSDTASRLLVRAQSVAAMQGMTLNDVIIPGDGSLTDTTLIRKFNPKNPSMVAYESRSKVFLNRDLSVMDAVLDLAHELTHFSFRSPFNPYVGEFDVESFVASTIEGKGGEVDAYLIECRVYDEIFKKDYGAKENCESIRGTDKKFSKELTTREFYKVGPFDRDLEKELNQNGGKSAALKNLTDRQAVFISSAYGVPYPLAAVREYVSIMGRACENDKKRLAYASAAIDRSPASTSENIYSALSKGYQKRCSQVDHK
ncbi:hypothetical protein M899_2555 [Bacteriovorax sp. BSW11_IV]|nr:hypothetical protein M899_2555 [Bacteriovorax sp. BSW11_IV]